MNEGKEGGSIQKREEKRSGGGILGLGRRCGGLDLDDGVDGEGIRTGGG